MDVRQRGGRVRERGDANISHQSARGRRRGGGGEETAARPDKIDRPHHHKEPSPLNVNGTRHCCGGKCMVKGTTVWPLWSQIRSNNFR